MSLKNLIEQWENNSGRMAHNIRCEKTHKEIMQRIKKDVFRENEIKMNKYIANNRKQL